METNTPPETSDYNQRTFQTDDFSQKSKSRQHSVTSVGTKPSETSHTNGSSDKENRYQIQKTDFQKEKIDFEARTSYDAVEKLLQTRSQSYNIRRPPVIYNILNKPEPDFRPQAYRPRPPKRNTQAATQPWKYDSQKDDYYDDALIERKEVMYLPKIIGPRAAPEYQFKAQFKALDASEDRMLHAGAVGSLLPRDIYKQTQPHDFRGYPSLKSLGLPEFVMAYERDPYNNKLHTRCPRTITGPPQLIVQRDIELGIFVPGLHQPPKWESRLHHSHDSFPNRPASFTRYRRGGRDPHEVFMDRVEESLNTSWSRDNKPSLRHKTCIKT